MRELEAFNFLRTLLLLLLLASSLLPSAFAKIENLQHDRLVDGNEKEAEQQCANIDHHDSSEYAGDQVGDFDNYHDSCELWANQGECNANPSYMLTDCRKSCRKFYRDNDDSFCLPINKCGLYVAISSIPNAGLGMYTAGPLSPLSNIFHPEIIINTIDVGYHQQLHRDFLRQENGEWSGQTSNGLIDKHIRCQEWSRVGECKANPNYMLNTCKRSCTEKPDENKDDEHWWLPSNYFWEPKSTYSIYDAMHVDSLVPGLGMLANSHPGLVNAQLNSHPYIDTAGLQRDIDPGAGAYSTRHGLSYFTTSAIASGMELFVDYGNEWFETREKKIGTLPLSKDYPLADELLSGFFKFVERKQQNETDNSFAQEMLSFVRNDLVSRERTRMAIPSTLQDAKKALDKGAALHSIPNAVRSQEWLEQNGQCLDNIVPRSSTLPQAGRGAFAMRPLSEGDVIAPAPMIHFRRSDLHMYSHESIDKGIEYKGEQLLLNYCYGHPDSSLLLFPYSPVTALINTKLDKSMVNARIQWSTMPNHHNEWLDLSVEEVLSNQYAGLMMEFVATRDISKGDEIFIDYGHSWKQAWNSHLNQWYPPTSGIEDHERVEILNAEEEIRTSEEQINDPYPSNVLMICFVPKTIWDVDIKDEIIPYKLSKEKTKQSEVAWSNHGGMLRHIENSRKCSILDKYTENGNNKEVLYKATIESVRGGTIEVNGIPRLAIRFVDKANSADQYNITNAFRHEIGIPDDKFPRAWRDQALENQEDKQDHFIDNTAHWNMEDNISLHDEECRFFLAESSISGAGMTMYAGTDIEIGEYSQPEIAIHILDFKEQGRLRCEIDESKCQKKHWWLPNNYEWVGAITLGATDAIRATAMIAGLGALGNYHTGLYSAEIVTPQKNNSGLHRRKDPGAGAITTYENARFQFIRPLKKGAEVFISYGENWLTSRDDSKFIDIPLSSSYRRANKFMKTFERYSNEKRLEKQFMMDTLSFVREELVTDDRLRTAIPKTVEDLQVADTTGSELHSVPDFVRSVSWLREHGRCLDYIREGSSTILGAGRGAFARLDMPKGHIIAPAPVLQLDRALTEILWQDEDGIKKVGDQLILNYSYGHRDSSVLLFPYSPVTNLINHSPGKSANAVLQWSTLPLHRSSWTALSADDVLSKEYSGLILEFVATRNIEEGEEIFIDYGPSWEAAWNHHKKNWKPIRGADEYIPASEFNAMDNILLDKYPRNVDSLCFLPDNFVYNAESRTGEFGEERIWYHDSERYERRKMKPCSILERYGDVYTVEIKNADDERLIVSKIPRKYITFIDMPYTTDQTMPGTFRHEIHLPDSLFPLSWIGK